MTTNNILRKYSAMLAMTVLIAFLPEACTKEQMPGEKPDGNIVMTTKASQVNLHVAGEDIVIDWGDGKKSSVSDDLHYNLFSHEYSSAIPRYISITGNITVFSCSNGGLTALDVSGSTGLKSLDCGFNQLTALDLSKNTALEELSIYGNQLTTLDLSKNTALKRFSCYDNKLANLILSAANTALGNIDCEYNKLTGSVLNDLFKALPNVVTENMYYPGGYIYVQGNPGEVDCDRSIAEKKGWGFRITRPR